MVVDRHGCVSLRDAPPVNSLLVPPSKNADADDAKRKQQH